jgi:hypothetical protein
VLEDAQPVELPGRMALPAASARPSTKGAVTMHRRFVWASAFAFPLLSDVAVAAPAAESDAGSSRGGGEPTRQFELDLATRARKEVRGKRATPNRASASVSSDGSRIVFASTHDLLRDGSNADGNLEIFLLEPSAGVLRQLTTSEGGEGSVAPRISAAGTRIVFVSDRDLLGGSNADDDVQLFLYDTLTGGLAQLTHAEGGLASFASGVELSLDDAGVRVAFASDRDLLDSGNNADENLEVFLLDTTTRGLEQITQTTGGRGCFAPAFSGEGRLRWSSDVMPAKKGQELRVSRGS